MQQPRLQLQLLILPCLSRAYSDHMYSWTSSSTSSFFSQSIAALLISLHLFSAEIVCIISFNRCHLTVLANFWLLLGYVHLAKFQIRDKPFFIPKIKYLHPSTNYMSTVFHLSQALNTAQESLCYCQVSRVSERCIHPKSIFYFT